MKILIVGQGLAGTLAGFRLERAGCTVHYLDDPAQTAASSVAAGIVNPITGRRFVKSWRIDELLPEVHGTYRELETYLGGQFWFPQPLIRTLYNRGDVNDWQVRSADAGYATYMEDAPDPGTIAEKTEPVFAYAGVRHAGRVAIRELVDAFRARLQEEGRFFTGHFDYDRVPTLLGQERATDGTVGLLPPYDRIVFCEGWRARFNPYFQDLPYGGNKGEALFVRIAGPPMARLFKHRVFIVPVGGSLYWVGATSENGFTDDAPTENGRQYLEGRLREILRVPYELIDHRAAVRPTVRDRRMLIGVHAHDERLSIFNGLGTKGASLAPLGAKWLEGRLLRGEAVPGEVDIARFSG